MDFILGNKEAFALLFVRILAGVLFALQGYDKIFTVGLKESSQSIHKAWYRFGISEKLIRSIVLVSSFIELTGGVCLIAGFLIYPVLYLLAMDLLLVCIAMSLREPLWDMKFVWPRALLVVLLLLVPFHWHHFSVDYWMNLYGG